MNNKCTKMGKSFRRKGIIWGIIFILAGILFLSFNLGGLPLPFRSLLFSWQMLLITIGIVQLFTQSITFGSILIFTGGFFIIPKVMIAFPEVFGVMEGNFTQMYWPVILVFLGVLIVIRRFIKPKYKNHYFNKYSRSHELHKTSNPLDLNCIFFNDKYSSPEQIMKGGELNSVFGNLELDLRKAILPEGETYLEINCVFGGITLLVPDDWNIEKRVTSVFGGFMDQRTVNEYVDLHKKLVITGNFVFGGGEIKN